MGVRYKERTTDGKKKKRGRSYRICAFEGAAEHAPVCGVDAEVLV